jgi:hypothetical protein
MNTAVMYERLVYTDVISRFLFFKHSFYEGIKIEDIFFIYKIYFRNKKKTQTQTFNSHQKEISSISIASYRDCMKIKILI